MSAFAFRGDELEGGVEARGVAGSEQLLGVRHAAMAAELLGGPEGEGEDAVLGGAWPLRPSPVATALAV